MRSKRKRFKRRPTFEKLHARLPLAASLELDVAINEVNTEENPLLLPASSEMRLNYTVTNTGSESLTQVAIEDDRGSTEIGDNFSPQAVQRQGNSYGPLGQSLATFEGLKIAKFLHHPTLPIIYGSAVSHNSIAVINTSTMKLDSLVPIGSHPYGMAITDDGSILYVANASSTTIGVLDTRTLEVLPRIFVDQPPQDVEVAADGTLFVLQNRELNRIDPTTGQELSVLPVSAYSGELTINASKDRLYYADYGLSPASLYVFDITTEPASLVWESPHGGGLSGSNGQDLALSHDNSFISYAAGAGQLGYKIAKYDTSTMAIEGTFDTGAYPREITFSPDDAIAYTVNSRGNIKTWDTTFFASRGQFAVSGEAHELIVDQTGQLLLAAFEDRLEIFATGRNASANVGDTNLDGILDPGESWLYEAQRLSLPGHKVHRVTVGGNDADENLVVAQAFPSYIGIEYLTAKENIDGVEIATLPGSRFLEPSDARFEIVNEVLKVKEGHSLQTSDSGLELTLRDPVTHSTQHFIDLTVLENTLPWHNNDDPWDSTGDGVVSPLDALVIIDDLNRNHARDLPANRPQAAPMMDTNLDGYATPLDALLVIDFLNQSGEGEKQEDVAWTNFWNDLDERDKRNLSF